VNIDDTFYSTFSLHDISDIDFNIVGIVLSLKTVWMNPTTIDQLCFEAMEILC